MNSTEDKELTDSNLFYQLFNSRKPSTAFLFAHEPEKIPNLNEFTLNFLKEEDLLYQYGMQFLDQARGELPTESSNTLLETSLNHAFLSI